MGIPVQIKTDNALAYVSSKMKQFFAYYNMKHIGSQPYNHTGQAVVERSNHTLMSDYKTKRKNKVPQRQNI